MQLIEVNGQQYEFPDDMSDVDIKSALAKELKPAPAVVSNEPTIDPTKGMSNYDLFMTGLGKSIMDTKTGIQQLLGQVSEEEIQEREQRDAALMDRGFGMGGNIVGHMGQFLLPGGALAGAGKAASAAGMANKGAKLANIGKAFTAPTSIKSAAGAGAAYGLTQPGDKIQNTLLGGIGAGAGQAVTKGVTNTIAPKVQEAAKGLLNQGIELTPGQIAGGALQRVEDAMTSIPVIGDMVKGAQNNALKTFNKAAWNKVLKPVGEKLPDDMEVGRDAFDFVSDTLSKKYDDILPNMKGRVDREMTQDIVEISRMVETLPEARIGQFQKILKDKVFNNVTGKGLATGRSLKKIDSELGKIASNYGSAGDADQRLVGQAVKEVQSSLRRMLIRENPDYAQQLSEIDKAYSLMIRPENASKMLGAEDGIFTAAQLQNAVKTADKSFGKRNFAKGKAPMQDLSEPAKGLLSQKVPDSGTPFRSATMLTGGAGAAGYLVDPTLGLLAAPAAMYTKPGVKAMGNLLAKRPEWAGLLAKDIEKLTPLAKAGGTAGLLTLQ